MIKRKILIMWILIICYFIALFGSIYYTYAYFSKASTHAIELHIGETSVETFMSFDDVIIDEFSPYYNAEDGILIINASDPTSENAIGKLNMTLNLSTAYASRLRIKLMESYVKERTYLLTGEKLIETMAVTENRDGYHPFSYLSHGEGYLFEQGDEGYQYFPDIIEENQLIELNIIHGGLTVYGRQNALFVETIYLHLKVSVEVVQANRYHEIWGI